MGKGAKSIIWGFVIIAPDYARRFAMKQHGSMRAFYDWFVSRFIKLRDEYEAQLRKENSYG
jgi:hypothetical protein